MEAAIAAKCLYEEGEEEYAAAKEGRVDLTQSRAGSCVRRCRGRQRRRTGPAIQIQILGIRLIEDERQADGKDLGGDSVSEEIPASEQVEERSTATKRALQSSSMTAPG